MNPPSKPSIPCLGLPQLQPARSLVPRAQKIKRSSSSSDLHSMVVDASHSDELLSRLGASSLARITEGLATKPRASQTIAAPGRQPLRSFEDAASLFSSPSTHQAENGQVCSICLEATSAETVRQLACGHRFHQKCLSGYSCSQPSAPSMPCPDCRHPFNAFHDQDALGHAQARATLSSPLTALHMGIRHVRPADASMLQDEVSSPKRVRDHFPSPVSRKCRAIDDSAVETHMLDSLHSINNHVASLVLHQQDVQAVNLLQAASLPELLETLPDPAEANQSLQQHRQRKRRLTASARAKRRKERQRLLSMENAVKQLQQQQAELQQHFLDLSSRNEMLTHELIKMAH